MIMVNMKLLIWTVFVFIMMLEVAPNDGQILVGTFSGLLIGLLVHTLKSLDKAQ